MREVPTRSVRGRGRKSKGGQAAPGETVVDTETVALNVADGVGEVLVGAGVGEVVAGWPRTYRVKMPGKLSQPNCPVLHPIASK